MSEDLETGRVSYTRSGRINSLRFLPMSLAVLLTSIGMGYALMLAFQWGWYYSFATPAVLALPLAGVVYLAVALGHCRSGFMAVLLGTAAGVLMVGGYFYFDLVANLPIAAGRIDLVPDYIALRMSTDVEVDPGGRARDPVSFSNWLSLVLDVLIVGGILVGTAVFRASRAYCENCRRWMQRQSAQLAAGTSTMLGRLLLEDSLESLPVLQTVEVKADAPRSSVELEYCPAAFAHGTDCPVYVTAVEFGTASSTKGKANAAVRSATPLKQVSIRRDELALLAERIPALLPSAATAPTNTAVARTGRLQSAAGVRIEQVESEGAESVFTARNTTVEVMLSLMPIGALLLGAALALFGISHEPWNAANVEALVASVVLIVAGTALFAFGAVVCYANVDYFNFWHGYRTIRGAIASRPDAIVDPDDPEAVYVNIVPRSQWSTLVPDHPSDGGFLRVDRDRGELLYEGIKFRYRIAGEAIAACEVESINPLAGRSSIYVTVVRTRSDQTGSYTTEDSGSGEPLLNTWEAPFLPRPTRFGKTRKHIRHAAAADLRERIEGLVRFRAARPVAMH